ncbi:MAG TPA: hypothetical protein VJX67_15875 [Blastocatellia bacterium]|nr:hypothetical protein [Blastocatellia bacterium]
MGQQYKAALEEKIRELGGSNLRVFINDDGVEPAYRKHLEETFHETGVKIVESRTAANFVFEGHCEPEYSYGQVAAFFKGEQIAFAGAL